ncbi:MAG: hypothetical protein HY650_11460 [Acidobacteria bacterium]|nr:hypothetical protein [Acidobacteriota bacterium]
MSPRWLQLSFVIFLCFPEAHAERLPIKAYTTTDGLSQNVVNRIVRDARGFLWFCTEDGLSRYDGYAFTNYRKEQGLPDARVRDLLETREGEYWVATGGGLCRFDPIGQPSPRFTVFYPGEGARERSVTTLLQDRSGTIWCGTGRGLFKVDRSGGQVRLIHVDIGLPLELPLGGWISALCVDRYGTVWIGGLSGLYRRRSDGAVSQCSGRNDLPQDFYQSLLEDSQGYIWAATRTFGIYQLMMGAARQLEVVKRNYTTKDGLYNNFILALLETSEKKFWVATSAGLCELIRTSATGGTFRQYPKVGGLGPYEIQSLGEDKAGNLWMGTNSIGALRWVHQGFTTYDEADGITAVTSILEDANHDLCLAVYLPGDKTRSIAEGLRRDEIDPTAITYWTRLGRFDGRKFKFLRPNVPKHVTWLFGWGSNQVAVQDHIGEWWIISSQFGELYRFPKISRFEDLRTTRPKAVYTVRDGLGGPDLFRIFEDSRGDVWVSSVSGIESGLVRWDRTSERFRDMSHAEGMPSLRGRTAISFRNDRAGKLWIGFSPSGLVRYSPRAGPRGGTPQATRDGQFISFTPEDGVPAGSINDLYIDDAGRLWIASTVGGLARLDDTIANRPSFVTYTTANGLSSNYIYCITEDRFGRLYVGTARGVDRLDPATGRVKHFTSTDGLLPSEVRVAFRDREGNLWFGGTAGLSLYTPEPDPPQSPPPIFLSGVRIEGNEQPISSLGETEVVLHDLASDQGELQFDFVGLRFGAGESLLYQHKLEGADADWSRPSTQRSVNYANLAPGRYHFAVRAVNSDGVFSINPATVTFNIAFPIWQRWWFLTLGALVMSLAIYFVHRYRVARIVELERVRTRIATDLHDDIGSNLTRIALLSEVVRQQTRGEDAEVNERLSLISGISRESVDSMSDIVWAINPKRDRLSDLTHRMRRFAEDAFHARGIDFQFQLPDAGADARLGADMRRDLYLIFKECVHNIVRHSGCRNARIDFQVDRGWIVLAINDDGKGFDPDLGGDGQGLQSMHQRAEKLGGQLEVTTDPDSGTNVTLRAPLR